MNYSIFRSAVKVNAFTLLELLVVMVLSIILTAVAFSGYLMIQQQYVLFKKTQNQAFDFQCFNTSLIRDFKSEGLIQRKDQQLIFYKQHHNVVYDFNENKISRNHSSVTENPDTISFNYNSLTTFFQSDIVTEGLVDSMVLSLTVFELEQKMIFKKTYSSLEIIKGINDEYRFK